MPDPTKLAVPVPSEDPKKKKPEEKPEDAKDTASKKKEDEKEGEELVRVHCGYASILFAHMRS